MKRFVAAAFVALILAGCASRPVPMPENVTFGARPRLPAPPVAAPGLPPRIVAAWFSSGAVKRGQTWAGRVVTTTNVASVEVRTNLFSIDVPRRDFGKFSFTLHVFDVPPIFVRGYRLRIVARNSAGVPVEEDLPFRIR